MKVRIKYLRGVAGLGDLGLVPELRLEEAVPEAPQLGLALEALVQLQPLQVMNRSVPASIHRMNDPYLRHSKRTWMMPTVVGSPCARMAEMIRSPSCVLMA